MLANLPTGGFASSRFAYTIWVGLATLKSIRKARTIQV